jgi:hypothetical protein
VVSSEYRLRKALTTQLHTLRQELGPKEESLMRATEKLQETDREYELSLQVRSVLRAVVIGCWLRTERMGCFCGC